MQRETLAERIAAEAAKTTATLSDQQIEACARILLPVLSDGGVMPPAEPLHYSL